MSYNVRDFGASGDGATDETAAIAAALTAARGYRLSVPAGRYMIDATVGLWPQSGTAIELDPNAILEVIPNGAENYRVFGLRDCEGVRIAGGTLIGDRGKHKGTTGEWGHGIAIGPNASGITVESVIAKEMWGDGFYVGDAEESSLPRDIALVYVVADHCRRQGLSITAARSVHVSRSKFLRTEGTPPAAGIDLEPNPNRGGVYDVVIEDCILENNQKCGILVMGNYGPIRNVDIRRNKFSGNRPLVVTGVKSNYKGKSLFRCKEQKDLRVE